MEPVLRKSSGLFVVAWMVAIVGPMFVTAFAVGPGGFSIPIEYWALFHPLPAILMALFVIRPGPSLPGDFQPDDWGTTLGHPWVARNGQTQWVSNRAKENLIAKPAAVYERPDLDGFVLEVPPPGDGMPSLSALAFHSWAALSLPVMILAVLGLMISAGRFDLLEMLVVLGSSLGTMLGMLVVCVPWLGLASLPRLLRDRQRRTRSVQLKGRRVTVDGDDTAFFLDEPGQVIERRTSDLVLRNDETSLVIPGRQVHLDHLERTFRAVRRAEGDAEDVPEDLARMRGARASDAQQARET